MISRRTFLGTSLAANSMVIAGSAFSAAAEQEPAMRFWDNHAGFGYTGPQDVKLLDAWRAAGVHYLSINVGFDLMPWSTTFLAIANYTRAIEARSDLALCSTFAEVLAAWQVGKMALTFDIEGMGALNGELSLVETYYRLGVRQMAIAYNVNNDAGGGCHDDDKGLTDFGRAVVAEMNRVGMVVDCAHSGIQSGLEAMRLSSKPCIFSHANARALRDHERNVTDEQIKAVAKTGGVVGVNGLNLYLGDGPATAEGVVAHIDYIAKLVGVQHVGIALDYDPSGWTPPAPGTISKEEAALLEKYWPARQYPASVKDDYLGPAALPRIVQQLRSRGYGEEAVRSIMAGNFMRVAAQAWAD